MRVKSIALALAVGCGPDDTSVASETSSTTEDPSSSTTAMPTTTAMSTTTSSSTDPDETETTTLADSSSSTAADSSSSDDGSTGEPVIPPCGNGVLDPDEGCDDGNLDDGDACDSDCVPTEAIVWTQDHHGNADQNDCATRVVANGSGTWIAGYLRDGELNETQSDAWLARIDDDGEWLWHWTMVGEGNDDDRALAVAIDANEDAYVGGWTTWNGQHAWLGRVDADGAALWTDLWSDGLRGGEYGRGVALVDGAPWLVVHRDEQPNLVQRWSTDGVHGMDTELVAPEGMRLDVIDLDLTAEGVWLVIALDEPFEAFAQPMLARLGPDGAIAESIVVNTPSASPLDDNGISGAVRDDGSAVLVSYDEPVGGDIPTVRVFDTEGVAIDAWLVELDGEPRVNDVAYGDDGTIVVVGERHDLPWARAATQDGTLVWDRLHTPPGGRGELEAVAIAPDGDVVVAGCVGMGSEADAWVRRYQP